MKNYPVAILSAFVVADAALCAPAKHMPAQLPSHDGKPGDAAKPVKVSIRIGQSNMVGMGTLPGAQNSYAGIYFSSDPQIPAGPLDIWQVGRFKTAPLAVFDADGTPARDPIAQGSFEVPERGVYQVRCGSGEASFVSMDVAGQPAYRRAPGSAPVRQEITLEPGERHAFTITGFTGEAPRFWLRKLDLLGNGDLEAVVKREGMFPWLLDATGNWTARQDVWLHETRLTPGGTGSPLIPNWNAETFGPEIGFGHVLGTFHDGPVLLIKDLRKDLNAPKMPVVVAGVGFGGHNMQEKFRGIMDAQMAVGDPAKHPDFAGNVAAVDTRDFWREVDESPKSEEQKVPPLGQ